MAAFGYLRHTVSFQLSMPCETLPDGALPAWLALRA